MQSKEFYSDPREEQLTDGEFSRREFLKLMGISSVLAGAAACAQRPVEKIIPYLNRPESVIPGDATWYASTLQGGPAPQSVLVKVREGRPIKLEGNPEDPINRGALSATGQASLWNLYDPDRLQAPRRRDARKGEGQVVGYSVVDAEIREAVAKARANGQKVRVVTGLVTGPATRRAVAQFVASAGDATHIQYDTISAEELVLANKACFDRALVPHYRFDKADYVLSLGADFLGTWVSPVGQARDWAEKRRLNDGQVSMSRLVAFEPIVTLTGTNADERYPVAPRDLVTTALCLAHELIVAQGRGHYNDTVRQALAPYAIEAKAHEIGTPTAVLHRVAQDLWQSRGHSLVVGGLLTGPIGFALQVVINLLNDLLGNYGETISARHANSQVTDSYLTLARLMDEMEAGEVDLLILADTNLLYTLPTHLGLREAMGHVPLVVALTDRLDETAEAADLVVPLSHALESWGDAEPQANVLAIVQPTIAPLYNTRALGAHFLAWAEASEEPAERRWYTFLRETWREDVFPRVSSFTSFETFWHDVLQKGVWSFDAGGETAWAPFTAAAMPHAVEHFEEDQEPRGKPSGTLELVCYATVAMHDGRFANVSWLQELPDPVTKITWDNYVSLAPSTAQALGFVEDDLVTLRAEETSVELPVHIQPGTQAGVVGVALGYGRTAAGRVGNGIGVNVRDFADVTAEGIQWAGQRVTLAATGRTHRLATTQGHNSYEGRPIIQETTLAAYQLDPRAGSDPHHAHAGEAPSMWGTHEYTGRRWGMAIDLNSCTGCSACVLACQVENNIPVVGRDQVRNGREMHWIRIDRYYSGDDETPDVVHQPMLCQHCEKAPCETVCPVLATVHNDEGLNLQVYNRCVGTRYCSNNCPYKVRRFNWYDWGNKKMPEAFAWPSPLHLLLNPDVTVREKGVMEKCTFCLQRIRKEKEEAKLANRELGPDDVKTACQQSCPTHAISFGNINDATSEVSRLSREARGYHVLQELNVLPQVTYLTKVRNKGV